MVATKGRDTLIDTLDSICPQLQAGDEILVVRSNHKWGHQARNEALHRCRGTHLMWLDDDDVYVKDALDTVRTHVSEQPDRVHIFCMRRPDTIVRPRWPLMAGFVGTPMFVVPRKRGLIGRWGLRYEGDFDFIESTMKLRGDEAALHNDVIALIGFPQ